MPRGIAFRPVLKNSHSPRRCMSKPSDPRRVDSPRYFLVLKETFLASSRHNVFCLAAALSFYAILSMAPLLVLLLSMAGTVLDRESIGRDVVVEVESLAGREAAEVAQTIVNQAYEPPPGKITVMLGIGILVVGAIGVFSQLQDALNLIWEVPGPPGLGLLSYVRKKVTSLVMALIVGTLLLISPLLTAVVTVVNAHLVGRVPQVAQLWQFLHFLVSALIMALIFSAIFKFVPHVPIKWRDVWAGAAATSLMFVLGQFLIGVYLGYSGLGSAYGAAGSLILLLLWVYYSSLLMFLGAEFTHVFARHYGSHARASRREEAKARASGEGLEW